MKNVKTNKITIGAWAAVALLVNLMSTQVILGFPRAMSETAGTAGWMIPVYVTAIILLVFTVIFKLYQKFEGMDLLDVAEAAGGKVVKIIVGVLFLIYLVPIIAIILREFTEDMKVIILPTTPISMVTVFFLSGMAVSAYLGLEALVRFAAIAVPLIIAGFLIITLGAAPHYELSNLFPILGTGVWNILGKGFLKTSIFSGLSLIFFLVPFIKTHENLRKVGYAAIIITGLMFTWGALSFLLAYSYPIALERFLPIYQLARLIDYGRFFQRVESIFVLIWGASALISLSAGFFFILHICKRTFSLRYYRPLIPSFAVLVFTLSLVPGNVIEVERLENSVLRNYLWTITLAVPFMTLLIASIRSKNRRKAGEKHA